MKKSYPIKKFTVSIEALGEELVLTELTQSYRDRCMDNPEEDTPRNALLSAGMTEEQYEKIGVSLIPEIYGDLVDFTYPNLREEYEKMIAEEGYVEPTEAEAEESKKN